MMSHDVAYSDFVRNAFTPHADSGLLSPVARFWEHYRRDFVMFIRFAHGTARAHAANAAAGKKRKIRTPAMALRAFLRAAIMRQRAAPCESVS
jgi:hypothetical protein